MPIMTKRVSADEAQAKRQGHTKETGRGLAIVKAMKAPPSWDSETRSARFVMTSQSIDRYRDRVVTAGGDTTEFERNPVAPLCHNTRTWPIGSWANLEKILKVPPRMEGDLILLPAGGPVAVIDEAEWMLANGGIRACSIGFVPNWDDVEMILDEEGKWTGGFQFNTWELVECSPCVVPANPDALAKMAAENIGVAREFIEDVLDNWAKTPAGLLMPRAEYEKAYKAIVEEIAADQAEPKAADGNAPEEADDAASAPEVPEKVAGITDEAIDAFLAQVKKGDSVAITCDTKQVGTDTLQDVPGTERIEITRDGQVVATLAAAGITIEQGAHIADQVDRINGVKDASTATPIVIPMTVDASHVDAEIMRVGGLLDGLSEKIAKVFGWSAPKPEERIEPTFEQQPPSPEAIAAAKQKATETLTRLREAGRIA